MYNDDFRLMGILFGIVGIICIFVLLISALLDEQKAEQRENNKTVSATIEKVRESHTDGIFSDDLTVYVTLDDIEYMLADSLEDTGVETGQTVSISYNPDSLIVDKLDFIK